METCKKNKNREHMKVCLFLFVNEFDLKNNNRIYRKPFWNLLYEGIIAINLFQVNLGKPWNYLGYCYKKVP